jgi:hypothetical protein
LALPPFVARVPTPTGWWVAWEPRSWPAAPGPWSELAVGGVAWRDLPLAGAAGTGGASLPSLVEDLVYLPPVAAAAIAERDAWLTALAARGVPALVQLLPGDVAPAADLSTAVTVFDPLPALVVGDLERATAAPAGSAVVWPLIAGISDHRELFAAACQAWRDQGVAVVQVQRLEPSPEVRRRLASSLPEEQWDAVFHRPPPSERDLVRIASAHGFTPVLPRPPAPARPARRVANRALAADLLWATELWLRLDRPPGRAAELVRVARRLEVLPHDVVALAREGNLGVLDWLGSEEETLLAGWCASGRLALLDELMTDYLREEAA